VLDTSGRQTDEGSLLQRRLFVDLTIRRRQRGSVTVLDLSGRLSRGVACDALLDQVTRILAANQKAILINLAEVDFVDSVGLNTLMKTVLYAQEQGGRLRLVRPRAMPDSALAASPLDLFPDEAEALDGFG
jgi:anti-sigma B factor antagonist